ncbi:MAG TPA: polysaccharide deacetylase family protein [Pedobacter sp.]|jgi:peptidoglycan/xylan/chitin deacetylase (PgdA/CDA1 family)
MYSIDSLTGSDLADKTLCITFDDGPGKDTYDIGKFLFDEGIQATFFVVGKYAYEHPEILQSLKEFGHLIANHTYEHPDMPYYRSVNGNVQDQILRTDTVIRKYINSNITYFRSPYGKWSKEVASDLNSSLMTALNHVGPIRWDMGGIDCYYWQLDRSVEDAYSDYLKEITDKRKGIVLFHDEIADMDYVKPRNKTLPLLKLLIPKLKSDGFRFVGLESINSIRDASKEKLTFYVKTKNNNYISVKTDSNLTIVSSHQLSIKAQFQIVGSSHGKVAIQSANDLYLHVSKDNNNLVLANKSEIVDSCLFDFIPVFKEQFMLRASNGNYLVLNKYQQLTANAPYMRNCDVFTFLPLNLPQKRNLSLSEKFELTKKRFLFIKSKVLQS